LLKVVSFNANGIRSAAKKGFFDWFLKNDIDVLCVQETKAQDHQLEESTFNPQGYFHYHSEAEKKGYSGVSIYTRHKPVRVIHKVGLPWADAEGRYVQVDFSWGQKTLSIASLYLPSGSSGEERQKYKFKFMDFYRSKLEAIAEESRQGHHEFILCGDWNIVHTEKDIKNFKSNQKTSGCLPEERAWLDAIFRELHFIDAFRVLNTHAQEYSWWSLRGQARAKNVGWRIDYQITTSSLRDKIKAVEIYRKENFSDHAPVVVSYDLSCASPAL
jgi:exodeoxyribonuclease III